MCEVSEGLGQPFSILCFIFLKNIVLAGHQDDIDRINDDTFGVFML